MWKFNVLNSVADPDPPDTYFLALLDPDPDPLVRRMDPDPDPSTIKQIQYSKKHLDSCCFVTSFDFFIFEK